MPSCLGLYVETNLIKYAKVTKDKDLIKVEAFGVKFTVGYRILRACGVKFNTSFCNGT